MESRRSPYFTIFKFCDICGRQASFHCLKQTIEIYNDKGVNKKISPMLHTDYVTFFL